MECKTKYRNISTTKIRILNLRFRSCGWNEGFQFYVLITFRFIFYSSTANIFFYISLLMTFVYFFSPILSSPPPNHHSAHFPSPFCYFYFYNISMKFYMYFIFLSFVDIHEWNWILLLIYCLRMNIRDKVLSWSDSFECIEDFWSVIFEVFDGFY